MGVPFASVYGKITAALFNQVVTQVNAQALVGIVPSSTTGSGSGVTVGTGGAVTFVNATSVSLNGVFSGTYDSYRILIQSNNRSSASSTQFHLRSAGADIASGYFFTKSVANGSSTTVSSSTSGTGVPLDDGLLAGQITAISMDLTYPAQAVQTIGNVRSTTWTSTPSTSTAVIGIGSSGTASCDGFSIYPLTGSATFSGVIRVYGYNALA